MMNKSLLIGLVAGAGAATAVGAVANFALQDEARAPVAVAADDTRGIVQRDELPAPVAPVASYPSPVAPPSFAPAPVAATPARAPVVEEAPAPRVVKAVRRAPSAPAYARVVDVEPLTRTVSEPREVCRDVEVVKPAPVRDEHQVAGSVIGAAIGGVIGNQVGDGRGRTVAKVAGVLGGAYAGNKVQERIQQSRTITTVEQRCETVYDDRTEKDGYFVTYEYEGRTQTVKMSHDPGSRLPVRNGRVVVTSSAG